MLNIKQRVFIDIMSQIPDNSNKMAKYDHVSDAYTNEVEKDHTSPIYQEALRLTQESLKREIDPEKDSWFIFCQITEMTYKEVEDARNWLVQEGYLREYVKSRGTMRSYFYGLTEKGWEVAPKYRELLKREQSKVGK